MLNLGECLLFLRPVGGADGFRAFEGHVFHHVGDAGFSTGIVDGSGIDEGVEGDDGCLMAFDDDEMKPVGEGELRDGFFEFSEGLCWEKHAAKEETQRQATRQATKLHDVRVTR